jgi:diguanylate cyclase (GGDEF)-like protein
VIDLDRFKELNDTLGHQAGDVLLRQLGPRLDFAVDDVDTLARLGGDEFALLMRPGTDGIAAVRAATQISAALERPFPVDGLDVHVEASVGIATFPDQGRTADALLRHADVAMYQAKTARTGYELYTAERDRNSVDRLTVLGELRGALERRELEVHYQPKAELRSERVTGVEALVRWRHPTRGLLPPDRFIPMAYQTGLIRPLAFYVLDVSLRQRRAWADAGRELTMAVNLSAPNLLDSRLPDDVRRLLEETATPPDALRLEVTETGIMVDPARAGEVLKRLAEIGVGLSLDDFGTGHSSLAHLKRLPVSEMKIDRSFVLAMQAGVVDAAIVRSTVELAERLGIRTVAEGVETAEVWDQLSEWGCVEAQGFLLSRPVPAEELTAWLDRRSERTELIGR